MNYENSWTRPGLLGKAFLTEAISLKWKQTNYDNPQTFETEYKGHKVRLEWRKGERKGAEMRIYSENKGKTGALPATARVASAVASHFRGQRKIFVNDKIFSTKVAGFKNRAPDDYTTYRPGWKKTWNWSA